MSSTPIALVTGATGFIGSSLVKHLSQEGWKIHALVRPSSSQMTIDVLEDHCELHRYFGNTEQLIDIFSQVRPTTVFHLASRFLVQHQSSDIEKIINSNLLFATQLAEAAAKTGCLRFVNTGTSWQHFQSRPDSPVNLYAGTKQAFEAILRYYHESAGLSVLTLKLYDTYGPGDPRKKLINLLIEAVESGESLDISPGEQVLDLTYIDDVIRGYSIAARMLEKEDSPIMESYFLSGERLTVKELVPIISNTFNQRLDVNFGGRPYRPREVMTPIIAGARLLPGWHPKTKLRDGLKLIRALSPKPNLSNS